MTAVETSLPHQRRWWWETHRLRPPVLLAHAELIRMWLGAHPDLALGGGEVGPSTDGREGSQAETPIQVEKGDVNLLAEVVLPQGSPSRGATGRVGPEIGLTRGGSRVTPPTEVAKDVEVPKGPPIVPSGPVGGAELAGQQGPARGTPQNPPNRGDVPLGTPNEPNSTSWVFENKTIRG